MQNGEPLYTRPYSFPLKYKPLLNVIACKEKACVHDHLHNDFRNHRDQLHSASHKDGRQTHLNNSEDKILERSLTGMLVALKDDLVVHAIVVRCRDNPRQYRRDGDVFQKHPLEYQAEDLKHYKVYDAGRQR